jgi:sigma-E factor negative regulatory protein RseC
VFLGYLLPFLILMAVMVTTYAITGKDGLAGLLGLASLLPYYFTLYYFRDKLRSRLSSALS